MKSSIKIAQANQELKAVKIHEYPQMYFKRKKFVV